jgi:hypothetical protein
VLGSAVPRGFSVESVYLLNRIHHTANGKGQGRRCECKGWHFLPS